MTAEPIARVVSDLRTGRALSALSSSPEDRRTSVLAARLAAQPGPTVDASAIYRSLVAADAPVHIYEDHPSIAPPWDHATVCYVNEYGNVLAMDLTATDLRDGSRDPAALPWEAQEECDWSRVRWLMHVFVWAGGRSKSAGGPVPTHGPRHMWQIAVYNDGEPADIHWLHLIPEYPMEHWDMANLVLLAALNFMGARNVELVEPSRPRAETRRLARIGVSPEVIHVFPAGRQSRSTDVGASDQGSTPLTSVRGHFCVDEETEILTRRGWLTYDALQAGDDVAGYDISTGTSGWTPCREVHHYEYAGPMVTVECRGLSMLLTPNHRALAIRARRQRQAPEIVTASELRPKHKIPRVLHDWADDGHEESIGVDMAALCGWVAAEGNVRSDGCIRLGQSSLANAAHCELIDALLERIDLPPADRSARRRKYESRPERVGRYTEPDGMVRWTLPLGLSQAVFALLPDKLLPAWFADLPMSEASALLDAFIDGDGHRRPNGRVLIAQKQRQNLDVLQAVAVRLGWKTSLRCRPNSNPQSTAHWFLYLASSTGGALLYHGSKPPGQRSLIDVVSYRGVVWCPTTDTGTFVARRDGHVFVTGNSHYGPRYGKGLLFGKYEGKFWRPPTAKGDAEAGKRSPDYVLRDDV